METEVHGSLLRCRQQNRVAEQLLGEELQQLDEQLSRVKLSHKAKISYQRRESKGILKDAEELKRRQINRHKKKTDSQNLVGNIVNLPCIEITGSAVNDTSHMSNTTGHPPLLTRGLLLRTPIAPAAPQKDNDLSLPQLDIGRSRHQVLFSRRSSRESQSQDKQPSIYRHSNLYAGFFKFQSNERLNAIAATKTSKEKTFVPERNAYGKSNSNSERVRRTRHKSTKDFLHTLKPSKPTSDVTWVGEPQAIGSVRRSRLDVKDVGDVCGTRQPMRRLMRELSNASTCSRGCARKPRPEAERPVHFLPQIKQINSAVQCPKYVLDDVMSYANRGRGTTQELIQYLHSHWERTLSKINLNKKHVKKKSRNHAQTM